MTPVIIGVRFYTGKISKSFWDLDKVAPARLDKRKSVKSKIWFDPKLFPIKNGMIVTCKKTGHRFILSGIPRIFKF